MPGWEGSLQMCYKPSIGLNYASNFSDYAAKSVLKFFKTTRNSSALRIFHLPSRCLKMW